MNHVAMPSLQEIRAAEQRIRAHVLTTPLVLHRGPLEPDSPARRKIYLKVETHQSVSSFKIRGVFNAVACLAPEERARGLSTVSAGNTAQALAWCGRHFGVPAFCLMPDSAPRTKIESVERWGGTPRLVPRDEVFLFLQQERWRQEPYAFVHPWTEPRVLCGHASMGLEIIEDLARAGCHGDCSVYIPVGGGGLMAGVASALRQIERDGAEGRTRLRIVAVEPAGCPALFEALKLGHPTTVTCQTMCDGIAVPYITEEMFPLLSSLVDDTVLVSEADIEQAMRSLLLDDKMVAEPSGAIALAAALAEQNRTEAAVCIVSGGSVDAGRIRDLLV